jgi:hypothetical protein
MSEALNDKIDTIFARWREHVEQQDREWEELCKRVEPVLRGGIVYKDVPYPPYSAFPGQTDRCLTVRITGQNLHEVIHCRHMPPGRHSNSFTRWWRTHDNPCVLYSEGVSQREFEEAVAAEIEKKLEARNE